MIKSKARSSNGKIYGDGAVAYDKLRSIVGPNVVGKAPQDEQICQSINHVSRVDLRPKSES